MPTVVPNAPKCLIQSASHGHSAPKLSVPTSASTSQCHSLDQSKALASKKVHPPASRSAQGFSNTKSASSSKQTHNQQAKFNASESVSLLSKRDQQHLYSSKQDTTKKGTHSCILVKIVL